MQEKFENKHGNLTLERPRNFTPPLTKPVQKTASKNDDKIEIN